MPKMQVDKGVTWQYFMLGALVGCLSSAVGNTKYTSTVRRGFRMHA